MKTRIAVVSIHLLSLFILCAAAAGAPAAGVLDKWAAERGYHKNPAIGPGGGGIEQVRFEIRQAGSFGTGQYLYTSISRCSQNSLKGLLKSEGTTVKKGTGRKYEVDTTSIQNMDISGRNCQRVSGVNVKKPGWNSGGIQYICPEDGILVSSNWEGAEEDPIGYLQDLFAYAGNGILDHKEVARSPELKHLIAILNVLSTGNTYTLRVSDHLTNSRVFRMTFGGGCKVTVTGGEVVCWKADKGIIDTDNPLKIKTGSNGYAEVRIKSVEGYFYGVYKLIPETEVLIYSHQIYIKHGNGWFGVNPTGAEDELFIKTPTAIAGIRGTELSVRANDKNTDIFVYEGLVTVSDVKGKNTVEVNAGHKTSVAAGAAPDQPVALEGKAPDLSGWPLVVGVDDDEIKNQEGGELGRMLSGRFSVEVRRGGDVFNQTWRLGSEGALVTGTVESSDTLIEAGSDIRGYIEEETLVLCVEAEDAGIPLVFTGKLESGSVSGQFLEQEKSAGEWKLVIRTAEGEPTPEPDITALPTPEPGTDQTDSAEGRQRLHPAADGEVYAYAYRNWNWANWGRWVNMGAGWHPSGGEKRAYLKFDLEGDSAPVKRAVLRLYQNHRAGPAHELGVYRVTGPWEEGSDTYHSGQAEKKAGPGELCWMQQPPFDPEPAATFRSLETVPGWVEVDITTLVRQWQAGVPNYGLVIKTTNAGPTARDPEAKSQFSTRESPQADQCPVLEITHDFVPEEETDSKTPGPEPEPGTDQTDSAEGRRLHPTADGEVYAYAYRNWNWANFGRGVNMGAGWHPSGGEKRAYLKFDLPVERAVLKLYQYHKAGPAHELGVYRVTGPWEEGSDTYHSGQAEKKAEPDELCWMQQPPFDPVPAATFRSLETVPGWVEVDVTQLVRQWRAGVPNYGLVIKTTNASPTARDPEAKSGFRTREYHEADQRPVLEIIYGGIADEERE